jgi:hypothetical protein
MYVSNTPYEKTLTRYYLATCRYDIVRPSTIPERWNLAALFIISSVLGAVACGSSLLLLWAALDSNNPTGMRNELLQCLLIISWSGMTCPAENQEPLFLVVKSY